MDGHGDYSPLDRQRLIASGLDGGAGGNSGVPSNAGGGVHPTVSELAARAPTPTALTTLAQYHSRYGLPPAMSVSGSNYAIMTSFLSGGHSPDTRKTLLPPELQHYWGAHSESFPRYLMAGGLYPSYPPLFPGGAESLSLLGGPGSAPTHHAQYQRFMELQKDAYLASMSAAAAANHHPALYGLPPGGIPPFLEQQQSTSHGATPLGLVKQEPKELSCTEKASKQSERRSMGFKVDLDYSRVSKDILSGSHLKEPKLSPSTSMGSPGKHDKKGNGSATATPGSLNGSHGLNKSFSNPSMNSTPRHQQEHLRTKCTSPRNSAGSVSPKGRVVNSPSNATNPRKTKSSSHTPKPSKAHPERSHSSTLSSLSPAESPIASVPTQAAAPIPLATVQHDGILLSALASPSSAAASSATTKLCSIKQQSERLNRSSAGAREHGTPVQDTNSSDLASSSDVPLDVSTEGPGNDHNSAHEDSCDIVVDSTEHDEMPVLKMALSAKSEHDRAIEETIDQVASATDSDTETAHYGAPSQGAVKTSPPEPVSSACTVTRTDIRCIVTSSVSSGGTRTVYAKTQPVPSVTATGSVHTMSTLTAPASALPYYHTLYSKPQGVKRVHATTYVPEVGIFKGPSIKSLAKNCLSPLSSSSSTSASLEDRCRFDSRSLHLQLMSDGRLRTRDNTPSPSRDMASHMSSGTAHSGLEVSSLDTTSLDSVSVRSQSVASIRSQSVASVRSPSVASVHSGLGRDDSSEEEMNGLVIDDEAEDTGHETDADEHCEAIPPGSVKHVDCVDADGRTSAGDACDIVFSGPETSATRTCDDKLVASCDTKLPPSPGKSSRKLSSKVPSDRGDKLFCDEAIDYSLPKNERTSPVARSSIGCASRVSGQTSRKGGADISFSYLVNTNFSSDKIGRDSQQKTAGGSNSFPKSGVPNASSSSKLSRSFVNNLPPHEISRVTAKNSSSPSSGTNRKVTTLTQYSDKLVPSAAPRRDNVTKRGFRDDTVMTTRCDSAPPISGSTALLPGASKFHAPSLKLGTELPEKFESSCDHSLGNIPVGIAVAQIRPHHIQHPRESQSQETNSHDIRHTHATSSVKTNPQTTQAAPAGSLPPNLVVTGHGVNPSPWLTQVPFSIHTPGATFDPSHYPITPPPGFKFAQDSITGQIFIVPNGVDAGGVWPRANFATPTGAGHPHFQTTINLPTITVNSSGDKSVRSKEESQPDAASPHETLTEKIIPSLAIADVGKQQAIAQALKGNSSGKGSHAPSITSATAATVLVNPVTGISSASPFVDIKTGQPTVQSRGCSPIIFEDDSESLTLLSTLSSLTTHRPSTCSVSVQTCDILMKPNRETPPVKIPTLDQGVQTATSELASFNPLSVQCPDLDSVDNITSALEIKANPDRSSYNPFTDPQILQAADGLELLSTLAEKRPKCSSIDDPKRIFPSPSDSFKSDTASIVAMDETLSPGDTDLKSGQCTPRRDVRRDLSPKWTLPKKESQTMTFGDFKTPPEMALDAHEVRVKMAEVQRQYKEKQKKLAKLQSKKTDEEKQSSNKRGPGRPPKKKSSKSDDDSSSSSSKTKEHHQHHHQHHQQHQPKKKRPAEELVDRVFRKLPPVKASKVSRSIHYVKSKTGPFFKRKSASSSVKKNKDLFGFDESNWPSFSERKHQEKVKVSGNVSDKSKSRHRSSSSQSEDSKHSHDTGNIFSNFESYSGDYSDRRSRPAKGWDTKLTSHSVLTVKTEPPSFHSTPESGLGLLAKFALTTSATLLSSTASSTSSPLLTPTVATTASGGIHTTTTTTTSSQLATTSFNTNISSSSIYGSGLYSNIYSLTSSIAPTITFGSRSSLMSSPHSSLMSFSTTSLASTSLNGTKLTALQPTTAAASLSVQTASATASPAVATPMSVTSPSSQLTGNAMGQSTVVSPLSSNLSLSIEDSTSGTTCASDCSPVKRRHDDDSDTDASESSPNKKRKPGRPRKINPDKSSGGTETIWAKKSNSFGLLQVPEPICGGLREGESKKLDINVMKPLFLDEEWTRRRSERIFLSETSPQPSPALSPSPRGEPVWKLSNFMPKSKKVLDVNKSLRDNEKDGDKGKEPNLSALGPAQLKPMATSTPILATSVTSGISVKTEEKELCMPTLSAFSWTSTTKLSEPSVIKSLEDDAKYEHSAFSGQKSKKHSRNRDPDKSKEKEKHKEADKSKEKEKHKEADKFKEKEKHRETDKSKEKEKYRETDKSKEKHKEADKSKDKEKLKETDKNKDKEKHREFDKSKDKEKHRETDKLNDKEKPKETDKDNEIEKDKETDNHRDPNKPKAKKKVQAKDEKPELSPPPSPLPPLIKKEKRAEEHSKIKLQKAKSLHDLTQRVKKKYSKASNKKQDDQNKGKAKNGRKKRNSSIDSSDTDNLPLSLYRDGPPTPEPRSCKLQTTDLREGLKVLYLNDGLFYEGTVKALQPPDVYGVLTAGQRGSRPHILCQEEVLKDAVLDVRPGSLRYLPEGTRICAFWSQQFSCLYPGTVVKSSPSPHTSASVSVDFDDGDSGRIPIDHIRLLPSDFPIVEYEPDPLENLPKRRRRTTSDASDVRKRTPKTGRHDKRNKDKEEEEEEEEVEDEDEEDDETNEEKDSSSAKQTSEKFWGWAGKSTKRPGLKGKAKKIFYRSISRGKEIITVGDSAVFVSTGRAHCPYIGHIKSLWEGWAGQMMVKVQWYYHPEETHSDKKLSDPRNALFESHHQDENDVQTISHKCLVLPIAQFKKRLSEATKRGKTLGPNLFYVAGFYEPSFKELSFYPGVS